MKRKFKETGFGKLLAEKVPDAVHFIGDVLPDKGVFGIAKNIIEKATLGPEEKAELLKAADEFELQFLQEEYKDRANARTREVDLKNTVGIWVQNMSAGVAVLGFIVLLFVLTHTKVEVINKDLVNILMGALATIVINIFGYWFGGSAGSAKKTDQLLDILNKK